MNTDNELIDVIRRHCKGTESCQGCGGQADGIRDDCIVYCGNENCYVKAKSEGKGGERGSFSKLIHSI